ncbi:MAG: metallophosphoesterase family protein [Anaerolineae bacterium]
MRILLISDIHANIVALDTVLKQADGAYDKIWCLGDIVGYGPAPNECVERLRNLGVESLAGNHDWAVLDKLSVEDFNSNARRAILWTQDVLRGENRDWLTALLEWGKRPEYDLTLVHGSPRHPIWEYILTTATATENLSYFDTRICLFGHTHVPNLFYQAGENKRINPQYLAAGEPLSLTQHTKYLLNPGSVGQPRDRDPRAAYAILDLDTRTFTPWRVEYNIAETQKAMEKARLPHPLIERLDYGV